MRKQTLTSLGSAGADVDGRVTQFDVMTVTRGTLTGSRWTGMEKFLRGLTETHGVQVQINSILGALRKTIHFELSGASANVAKAIVTIHDVVNAHNK